MTVKIIEGDALAMLRTLPAGTFQTCVTSPPYWNLRDYGVEGQMGLEETPEAFVAGMVMVFREVRRVLRDDGTLWLNLGSSYAARDMRPSPSRQPEHALSCGTGDTESEDCCGPDCACSDRHDARKGGASHHTPDSNQPDRGSPSHPEPIDHDTEHQDFGSDLTGAAPHDAQASTKPASFRRDRAACVPSNAALAYPSTQRKGSPEIVPSADMSACTSDTQSLSATSAKSNLGREVSGLACNCGSCGICWSNIAIPPLNIKAKDLISIPQLVALALQADGWYLRQDNIWSKPNPMPESIADRCTKAHEYVFLLTKRPTYFYDQEAIAEEVSPNTHARLSQNVQSQIGSDRAHAGGKTNGRMKAVGRKFDPGAGNKNNPSFDAAMEIMPSQRNARSVWTIATEPFKEAHFATMPTKLALRCVLAGSSERGQCPSCGAPWARILRKIPMVLERSERTHSMGQTRASGTMVSPPSSETIGWAPTCKCPMAEPVPQHVLDPFGGAGTTALVADRKGRDATIIELNPASIDIARRRITGDSPLFAEVEHAAPQQG